jgi:hypothetical protein
MIYGAALIDVQIADVNDVRSGVCGRHERFVVIEYFGVWSACPVRDVFAEVEKPAESVETLPAEHFLRIELTAGSRRRSRNVQGSRAVVRRVSIGARPNIVKRRADDLAGRRRGRSSNSRRRAGRTAEHAASTRRALPIARPATPGRVRSASILSFRSDSAKSSSSKRRKYRCRRSQSRWIVAIELRRQA